ncbi:MAG: apolipoprotein N-acyltransferase [Bosea sp. (in: a-proteobacteria)]
MTIAGLADAVMLAFGWRRRLIALFAGACGALTLAPVGLWPLLVVPMTAAIWLLDGAVGQTFWQRLRAGAAIGWWWGFGFFLAGFWWLGSAFLVEAEKFAWAMPFGVLVLPAGLALFPALAFALARSLWPAGGRRILIFALALTLAEWLRGWVLTGFPWNAFGMGLAENLWMAQGAAIFGLWGLTLLAVLVGAAPAALATGQTMRQRWQPVGLAVGCIGLLLAHGAWRLPVQPSPLVPGVKLRILQPNLPQDAKFSATNGEAILQRYLKLSDQATSPRTLGLQDVTHLVWPESAFPFLLNRTPQALRLIGQAIPPQVTLITGAARAGEALPGEAQPPIYNSIQVIQGGSILSSYDKVHLVPFGEYLPGLLDSAIRSVGLSQFVSTPGGFAAGARHAALTVRGLPLVAPLICYESVFPGEVVPPGPRPGLFLNVTNDGWFGQTGGPYQHFAQSRLRAIEEGLPLVRSANTGISAVTDGYGRVIASLGLGQEGLVDSGLPRAIPATIYARFGDANFAIMVVICGLFGFIRRKS